MVQEFIGYAMIQELLDLFVLEFKRLQVLQLIPKSRF